MKLFKNEVGRPSNEVLRKRRIVKVSIAIGIIAVIAIIVGGVTLLLSKNNTNNLKGAVSSDFRDNISVDVKFNNKNIKGSKVQSDPIAYEHVYLVNSDGKFKAEINIQNNNDYDIYYSIFENDTKEELVFGKVPKNKNKVEKINIFAKPYRSIDARDSDGITIRYMNDVNIRGWTCYDNVALYSSKNFVFSSLSPSGTTGAYYKEGVYKKESAYKVYAAPVGKNKLVTELYNFSERNYYYKWFTYETKEISKDTNNYSGQCMILNSNSEKYFSTVLSLSEKYPHRAGLLKFYNNKTACLNDKYGIEDNNVVWNDKIELIDKTLLTSVNSFKVVYDANGGNGKMDDQEITYGEPTNLRKNAFTKSGHRFTGWKAKRIIDGKDYFYGCTTTGDCKEDDAKWLTKDEMKSYFNYKDEEIVPNIVEKNETVTMVANWSVINGISPTQPIKVISLPEIFKPLKKISDFFKSIFNLFK